MPLAADILAGPNDLTVQIKRFEHEAGLDRWGPAAQATSITGKAGDGEDAARAEVRT